MIPDLQERRWITLIRIATADHLDTLCDAVAGAHLDAQAEAVQQLRTQVALLGIAAAHEHEPRRMPHAHAIALHDILARLRNVQQQVDEMVLQQVHLVHVQEAAVGACQQAGLERLLAIPQRLLDVERPHHAILGGAEWQVDHRHGLVADGQLALGDVQRTLAALVAARAIGTGITAIPAALHRLHARQQRGQRAHHGRLAGAAIAQHEHTTHGRIHRRDEQCELHLFLSYDCTERKGNAHTVLGIRWITRSTREGAPGSTVQQA